MSETSMRNTMRKHFVVLPYCHWQRIEDLCTTGIPDINVCVEGREAWIEAKQLDGYPKRPSTPVRIGLRTEQALWLVERSRAHGRAAVIAKIGRDWYLFLRGFEELASKDGVSRERLKQLAALYWAGEFDVAAVVESLFF